LQEKWHEEPAYRDESEQRRADLKHLWMRKTKMVILVTRSIEEAVQRSDGVIVISPARNDARDLAIALPRRAPSRSARPRNSMPTSPRSGVSSWSTGDLRVHPELSMEDFRRFKAPAAPSGLC
jgi:hypothetical protein